LCQLTKDPQKGPKQQQTATIETVSLVVSLVTPVLIDFTGKTLNKFMNGAIVTTLITGRLKRMFG